MNVLRLFLGLLVVALPLSLGAQTLPTHLNLSRGLALEGYDAVAYRDQQRAVKGSREHTATHGGATYWFASAEHRATFVQNPEVYLPAYGGWCAYAMGATGEKVSVNPKTFKVIDGRTYLFYNAFFTNTLESWNRDEVKLKASADQHWQTLIGPK